MVPPDQMARIIGDATAHAVRSLMGGPPVQQITEQRHSTSKKSGSNRKHRRKSPPRSSPPRSSPNKQKNRQWQHTADVLPRFDLADVDHNDLDALGKAEHKMGYPCYLCRKFGHLSGVHFPTHHKWCQADSDRWTSNREVWHVILQDLRTKQFTRFEIAARRSVDTSAWPQMSDREFLAAVMETVTGLPRWDDGTDPKTTPPQPIKDPGNAEFFQNMLRPVPSASAPLALPAPPGTMSQPTFAFQPGMTQESKLRKLKPKRGKRDRKGEHAADPVGEALDISESTLSQIALTPGASPLTLPPSKAPAAASLPMSMVGLPAHALNMRVQQAENSLRSLTDDRKQVWQQLGRIDQSVNDLKRSGNVSQNLMGTLLMKVGGVSPDEVRKLMQDARDAALAELPPSLDPQIEERLRLASLEDGASSGSAAPTQQDMLKVRSPQDLQTSARLSISSADSNGSSPTSEDLTRMEEDDVAPKSTAPPSPPSSPQASTPKTNEVRSWPLGWRPAQEWKMVDMAALIQCRRCLLVPPTIRRRNEGVHALSHTDQGLHMVVLAPVPGDPDTPGERAHRVVQVRSVGQRPTGHLVLGLAQTVACQNPLEPPLESTEQCAFDTWELNAFEKVFFWEEAALATAEELNTVTKPKRLCLAEGANASVTAP